jgi:4-diphosphocytidyl-2-C-methyl-D-erythritol kinase
LAALGALVGSDVPLFFSGPLSVLRSRGDVVEPLSVRLSAWCVLLMPPVHCSTPAVYRAFDRLRPPGARPPLDHVLASLGDPERLMSLLANDLEQAAFEVAPALREVLARATEIARGPVRMTGSGAALFRLFGDEAAARRFKAAVAPELGVAAHVVRVRA